MKYHDTLQFVGQADRFLKAHAKAVQKALKTFHPPNLGAALGEIVALDTLQESAKLAGRPISGQIQMIFTRAWRTASAVLQAARAISRLKGGNPAAEIPRLPRRDDWSTRLNHLLAVVQYTKAHPEIPVVDRKLFGQDVEALSQLRGAFGDARRIQKAITGKLDEDLSAKADEAAAWVDLYRAVARVWGLAQTLREAPQRVSHSKGRSSTSESTAA
jgi:hypothetical protein